MLKHQILPALALILGSVGGWVLSMRGMGVTIQGEDYVNFAEHKGLSGGIIFRDYYLRNAMLPQVTGLGAGAGQRRHLRRGGGTDFWPAGHRHGVGPRPLRNNDFLVIYGIVLFITIAIATLMVWWSCCTRCWTRASDLE